MLDGGCGCSTRCAVAGTTLNQALMYGYDAAGIDLDRKDFDAYAAFLGTWLKRKRLKHQLDIHPVRRDGHDRPPVDSRARSPSTRPH